ncbi:MAG: NAD(P)H-dependent oxidoreductase subunit E, partial [Candidatus Moranbacteria bacterium]|nr:NAD(P)H-dependent oxidoreductase subunit E [Candidatus Moranbacteria bacterium]
MPIQKILLQYEPRPENLLRALKEIQKENKYIGKNDCDKIAMYFSLPPARVFSLASFFDLLDTRPIRKKIIKVCSGGPCLMEKSFEVIRQVEMLLKIELDNDSHPKVKLETMSCLGLCDQGPVMMVGEQVFEKVRPENVDDIILN